jgi:hypothetical protein
MVTRGVAVHTAAALPRRRRRMRYVAACLPACSQRYPHYHDDDDDGCGTSLFVCLQSTVHTQGCMVGQCLLHTHTTATTTDAIRRRLFAHSQRYTHARVYGRPMSAAHTHYRDDDDGGRNTSPPVCLLAFPLPSCVCARAYSATVI